MSTRQPARSSIIRWLLLALFALAGILRALRLTWQPLWWDEGYSVYFATEPLAAMVRLTAQDIHPPLYYALLHGWLLLWGSAEPLALRTFSLVIGLLAIPTFWWMARTLIPHNRGLAVVGTLLLAISPMHIFYSQEVRMYGLELLLGMASTGFLWRMMALGDQWSATGDPHAVSSSSRFRMPYSIVGYVLSTMALLYAEYYALLLPLAHLVWALWIFRKQRRVLVRLVVADAVVALLYLPWLLYAVPELIPYVSQKVIADADRPLGLLRYFWRHLLAFTAGHVSAAEPWLQWAQIGGTGVAALLLLFAIDRALRSRSPIPDHAVGVQPHPRSPIPNPQSPIPLLAVTSLLPFAVAFLLNLRLPFFPEGGERVLLFVLPYVLLLVAWGIDGLWRRGDWATVAGLVGLLALIVSAAVGIWSFYTVPRYVENDYRPLIRQTVQQGRDGDTVFAVFPWQIGYWRAYAPVWGRGDLHGPWPVLTPSPAWNGDVAATLDAALARGKLWLPLHLALGGILESEIESYLQARTLVNFENRWYSPTTRLSGWSEGEDGVLHPLSADFEGVVQLTSAGVGARSVAAANEVLPVSLGWRRQRPEQAADLRVTVRLVDDQGRIWANRDYIFGDRSAAASADAPLHDRVGLLVPVGLPPDTYSVTVGVGPDVENPWLYPVVTAGGVAETVPIGTVEIVASTHMLPALRLPMQIVLPEPVVREGIEFLGVSGYDPDVPTLAGTQMSLSLFVRNGSDGLPPYELYVSLLNEDNEGVAGWEGWPLPNYPTTLWSENSLVRLPIDVYLPAALSDGTYQLIAGLLDPATGEKSPFVELGNVPVVQRHHRFEPTAPAVLLETPIQFGTHARLLGYDAAVGEDELLVTLHWEVLQTLLPPHQVFVHLTGPDGTIVSQDDTVPGYRLQSAPSGTWIPGEFIVDPHRLALPADLLEGATVRVGLYVPETGVRLPVTAGTPAEDNAALLPLP